MQKVFNVKFLVENDAFGKDKWQGEISSILEQVASTVRVETFNSICHTHAINDSNGNHIGYFCFDTILDNEVL